jgi:hypothetical protein
MINRSVIIAIMLVARGDGADKLPLTPSSE